MTVAPTLNYGWPQPDKDGIQRTEIGEIATRTMNLDVAVIPGVRIIVNVPADDDSRNRLARLRAHPEAARPRHQH